MQRHLERSVVLDTVSDFKSLYSWSVSEVGEEPSRGATKQIPWAWSLYFTLFDIQHISSVSQDRYSATGGDTPTVVEKAHIRATLRSGHPTDTSRPTRYSMFGTARQIEDLTVSIYRKSAGEIEDCRVIGGVSYTHDLDFRDETYPDYLGFTLYLGDEAFAQLASRIDRKAVDGGTLRVDGVEGFYSDWSPSISTSHIKVLTSDQKDHQVQTPDGCEIVPPRLGKLGGFDLSLWSVSLHPSADTVGVSESNEDDAAPAAAVGANLRPPMHDPQIPTLLKSLRLVAWIIAALLLVVAFK